MKTDIKSKLDFIFIVGYNSRSRIRLDIPPFHYFGRYATTRFLDLFFFSLTTTSDWVPQIVIGLLSFSRRDVTGSVLLFADKLGSDPDCSCSTCGKCR